MKNIRKNGKVSKTAVLLFFKHLASSHTLSRLPKNIRFIYMRYLILFMSINVDK